MKFQRALKKAERRVELAARQVFGSGCELRAAGRQSRQQFISCVKQRKERDSRISLLVCCLVSFSSCTILGIVLGQQSFSRPAFTCVIADNEFPWIGGSLIQTMLKESFSLAKLRIIHLRNSQRSRKHSATLLSSRSPHQDCDFGCARDSFTLHF
jgi:hypothetical protein